MAANFKMLQIFKFCLESVISRTKLFTFDLSKEKLVGILIFLKPFSTSLVRVLVKSSTQANFVPYKFCPLVFLNGGGERWVT